MDAQHKARLERESSVGVIVIDNPPINAGSAAVRAGLLSAIQAVQADASLQAAVLIGAGKTFIAGSDLREFGQPLAEPQLRATCMGACRTSRRLPPSISNGFPGKRHRRSNSNV